MWALSAAKRAPSGTDGKRPRFLFAPKNLRSMSPWGLGSCAIGAHVGPERCQPCPRKIPLQKLSGPTDLLTLLDWHGGSVLHRAGLHLRTHRHPTLELRDERSGARAEKNARASGAAPKKCTGGRKNARGSWPAQKKCTGAIFSTKKMHGTIFRGEKGDPASTKKMHGGHFQHEKNARGAPPSTEKMHSPPSQCRKNA